MSKQMKALVKTLHIVSACLWLGSAACIVLLQCLRGWADEPRLLLALNESFSILDFAFIIPAAMGSAFTGLLMCLKTSWGVTRYWWILTKVILTLSLILIGTAFLGPWQLQMVELSRQPDSILDPGGAYDLIRLPFTLIGVLQVLWLITIVAVSVRKPWGRRIAKDKTAHVLTHGSGATA
jgi:uncharacterized membrane protein